MWSHVLAKILAVFETINMYRLSWIMGKKTGNNEMWTFFLNTSAISGEVNCRQQTRVVDLTASLEES